MKERLSILFTVLLITGCASVSPTYINDGEATEEKATIAALNPVHFKIADSFKTSPPNCIAVLPLHNALDLYTTEAELADNKRVKTDLVLSDAALEQLRWNLYAHLSPYSYRDVELEKVNKVVDSLGNDSSHYAAIASKLNCDALLLGEVIDYSATHFGIYSQASIGVRMQLIRVSNNEILWEGRHIAKSQAGTVPLTPVDIIVGIYSATENMSDEQLIHVEDDLFRRLLSTWNPALNDASEHILLANQSEEQSQLIKDELYSYAIAVKNLYLRSGPGTQFTAETVLDEQDKLAIVDHKHAPWLQVKVAGGQLGYVNKKYIKSVVVPRSNEQLARLVQ